MVVLMYAIPLTEIPLTGNCGQKVNKATNMLTSYPMPYHEAYIYNMY